MQPAGGLVIVIKERKRPPVLGAGTVKHIFAQCSEVDDSVINAAKQSESCKLD